MPSSAKASRRSICCAAPLSAPGDASASARSRSALLQLAAPSSPIADRLGRFRRLAHAQRSGRWLPENTHRPRQSRRRLSRRNPPAEIDTILRGVWDNLGRLGAEFAHLDRSGIADPAYPDRIDRIVITRENIERLIDMANDGKPALVFAAHLANWELPAICAADLPARQRRALSPAEHRRPSTAGCAETRGATMGKLIPTGLDAPLKIAAGAGARRPCRHAGRPVLRARAWRSRFFGRTTKANPLLARLARHFDCPIHGTRVIRLPGHRFRAELTEEIKPARDAEGKIDIQGTMQIITDVIEGWVREHPEQWLWLHRRWRPEDAEAAHCPVFTLVHSRLIRRCVFGSRALMV